MEKLSAHAQVDDEELAVVELDCEVLPLAAHRCDRAADEAAGKLGGALPADGPLAGHVQAGDPPAQNRGLEPLANRLDLGKLRHLSPRKTRPPAAARPSRRWSPPAA